MSSSKHPANKSESGFTLIEMLIVIAIIGILASVAIPQYNQYKIRGYDAQTKQALKNMHLLCNAYWLDTSALRGCDLSKIKEQTYGFNHKKKRSKMSPVILVDDVLTTGATLRECREILELRGRVVLGAVVLALA